MLEETLARYGQLAAGLVLAGFLAGCGLFGNDAEVDPCLAVDAKNRAMDGTFIRQPAGVATFQILPVDGKLRRNGSLSRLYFDGFTFRARADAETGGYRAGRGSTAVPIAALASVVDGIDAFDVTYNKRGGDSFNAQVVIGVPTVATELPTAGNAAFSGPVVLKVQNRAEGASSAMLDLSATATFAVKYGSQSADLNVFNISGDGAAALPFRTISWTGISLCSTRVGSSGSGLFSMSDGNGLPVNFAGPSPVSPSGSAVFDGNLYGTLANGGLPAGLGGGFLIQGDTGVISGMVVAKPVN